MESWRSGSIHSDVPVYPKCPYECAEKYFPDWDGAEGVSQPKAREVPAGAVSRRVKRRQSLRTNQRRSSLQKNMSESCQVFCGREQPGVSRHSAEDAGVFVLNFALDNSLPKRAVIGSGRNRSSPRCRWIVRSVHQSQRTKYFALTEPVQTFIGDALQCDRQNDEADITIFSSRARIGCKRSTERRGQ